MSSGHHDDFPPQCGKCGKSPADHIGWEQRHLFIRRMSYQDTPAEEQPPTGAGATAAPGIVLPSEEELLRRIFPDGPETEHNPNR